MIFFRELIIPLLIGAIGGLIVVIFTKIIEYKHEKKDKQKQLYGKLIGLQEVVCDYCLYNSTSRINLQYYLLCMRLSGKEASTQYKDEIKIWQQIIKDAELGRSEKFATLFETIGLIWATFPKQKELDNVVEECLNIKSIFIECPDKFTGVDEIKKWREESEKNIRHLVNIKINDPLNNLIAFLRKKINDC